MFPVPNNLESYQRQANDLAAQIGKLQQYQPALTPVPPQIDYVNGLEGAKTYLREMPANGQKVLMDRGDDKFFVVSKDANGVAAPVMIGHFTIEQEQPQEPAYATKADFEAFKTELKQLLAEKGDKA